MKLLLIRHGETVDNVAGRYAGVTDSPLTAHGHLQALRLGVHLSTPPLSLHITHVFSSDLQRAVLTADAICSAQRQQKNLAAMDLQVKKLELLREKDFGFYEGKVYFERPKDPELRKTPGMGISHNRERPGVKVGSFQGEESREMMQRRMNRFIDDHLWATIINSSLEDTVVIVAHGIILLHLWRCILLRFAAENVTVSPKAGMVGNGYGLEYLGAWSNTGWWEVEVTETIPSISDHQKLQLSSELPLTSVSVQVQQTADTARSKKFPDMALVVTAVNCTDHLKGFKKSGGGLGNVEHDRKQKTMESFFVAKKRKLG